MIAVNNRNATDLELTILEELLEDECKCESLHRYVNCSVKVTHLITDCESTRLICFNTAKNSIERRKRKICAGCFRPASECWSIRPV